MIAWAPDRFFQLHTENGAWRYVLGASDVRARGSQTVLANAQPSFRRYNCRLLCSRKSLLFRL